MILLKMKETAEAYLGTKVCRAPKARPTSGVEDKCIFGRPIRLLGGNHEIPRSVDFPAPLGAKILNFWIFGPFWASGPPKSDSSTPKT